MERLAGAAVASCMILLLLLVPCAQFQGQPPEAPEEAWAEGQPPEALEDALTMLLSEGGCGAFAALVARTAGVGDTFREQIGSDLGLTILCPDDEAVGAFVPRFHSLTVDEQAGLLLYHGLRMAYSEELHSRVYWLWEVLTLDGEQTLIINHYRGRAILSPWPPSSQNEARITKTVVDDDHLAVYLIDAVLIPTESKKPDFFWDFLGPFLLVIAGLLALFLLWHALVYLCSLVCRLRRWCKDRATAYVSAARVNPHGQQEH
ncbi:fasciclin-like arabinogalactan protein 2 [Triticum dicoccoides]|uniref:fasciclin-like arabinogalactan protein 2 n=1 Tax=Triticum dicoccoides TaxID=85692 RepID=UPI000E7D2253|nr:fasciclin-like arabinogalactan protein 2 [Triticum dicoccoides]